MKYALTTFLLVTCLSIWSCKKTPLTNNKVQTSPDGFFKLINTTSGGTPNTVIDHDNNIVACGSTGLSSSLDFGGISKQLTGINSGFIVKYDSEGTPLWVNILSAEPTSTGNKINRLSLGTLSTDDSGNIYCVGSFTGILTLGNTVLTSTTANAILPVDDLFLIKYDKNGNMLLIKQIASSTIKYVTAVVADNSGKVYLAGYFYNSIDFGNGTQQSNGSSIFLASYNADGSLLWDKLWGQAFPGQSSDFNTSELKIKTNGNLILNGNFAGNQTIDNTTLLSQSTQAMFIAEFTNSGNIVWAKGYGGNHGTTNFTGFTIDANDNIYAGGTFNGSLPLGSQTLQSLPSRDAAFLLKLDNTGTLAWVNAITGSDAELSDVTQYAGKIYCNGNYYNGNLTIGDTTLKTYTYSSTFLASFDSNGKLIKAKQDGIDGFAGRIMTDNKGYVIENGLVIGNFSFADKTYPISGRETFILKQMF